MSRWLPRPRRMFWRIYAYGVLMLMGTFVAMLAAVGVMGTNESKYQAFWKQTEHVAELAGTKPSELPAALEASAAMGLRVSVYGPRGEQLGAVGTPVLEPLDDKELRQVWRGKTWFSRSGDHLEMAAVIWSGDTQAGYVVSQSEKPLAPAYGYLIGMLASVLLALTVLSYPMARMLVAPMERLMAAVREFGQGRLSTRARLQGRHEVAELGSTFDEMAGRMEALIRGQKELLANVSHELRTPLARLGVTLDLVEEGQPDELARRLPELRRDIGELQALVDGVLQMARLDLAANQAGQPGLGIQRKSLSPPDFLRDTAERFQRSHPECPLQLELPSELPSLAADAVLLRRAVHNLLDNARKYSEPGSPVTLRARADGDTVLVEVEDRGIGISAQDLPGLSTPFFRTDRSRTRDTGGLGLGLTLVRRIVEAHGGTLAFHSEPERGTRVTLALPRAPDAREVA